MKQVINDLSISNTSVEEIFMELTSEKKNDIKNEDERKNTDNMQQSTCNLE